MGSLSVTWDEHYRAPFEPLIPGVSFASTSDPDALEALVDAGFVLNGFGLLHLGLRFINPRLGRFNR